VNRRGGHNPPGLSNGLIRWFAANPVVANLLMFALLGLGIYSVLTIRKEAFPPFAAESVSVLVPFRGGTPEDVERGVSIKIEESLESVEGIEQIRSISTENAAEVIVEVADGHSLQKLLDDVKIQVDAIPSFPEQAEKPVVTERPDYQTVLWVDVHGSASETVLKETARELKDKLLAQDNISRVITYGAREYEMSIEVSEARMRAYGLTFDEVAQAVSSESIDLAGGVVRSQAGEISLRVRNQGYTAADFAAIPLRTPAAGGRITLGQVAQIRDGFVDQEVLGNFDGIPTVSLQILNKGDDDIIKGSKKAREIVYGTTLTGFDRLRGRFLPPKKMTPPFATPAGVTVTAWADSSETIRDRLRLLYRNGGQGILLVLIALALFLNIRLALWVALGIPISLAGALFVMPGVSMTLNELTSFSLIIVLGIIVDDAIVIGESIFREKRMAHEAAGRGEKVGSDLDIAERGTVRVLVPALFGVLTTVAAFYPLSQVSGRMGQAFGKIAIVVMLCLLFSIVESKLILPAHLTHVNVNRKPSNPISRLWARFQGGIDLALQWVVRRIYAPLLARLMPWRYSVLALAMALLLVSVGMVGGGIIRRVFFPDIMMDVVTANIEMEQGLPVTRLHDVAREVEASLRKLGDDIENETGDKIIKHIQIQANSNTKADIVAEMTPGGSRQTATSEVKNRWRKHSGHFAGTKSVRFGGGAGPPGDAYRVRLISSELDALRAAASDMKTVSAKINGVYDIQDSFDAGKPEIGIELTPLGEAAGIDRRTLANEVRNAFFGREAQRVQRGRDEVKVMVRYPIKDRAKLENLRRMRVRGAEGQTLPFDVVAKLTYQEGLARIERVDNTRVVEVSGELDKSVTSSEESIAVLKDKYLTAFEERHPDVRVSFEGEAEQQKKSLNSLGKGFLLSMILIYILLAIPLKSYFKPFIVMAVIPFGIFGALMGHWITGVEVSILSMFGIVALSGVVVNDSLVFLCAVDAQRAEGRGLRESIVAAGQIRFRAILLTSVTTFLGLLPLLTETSVQAQFLIPMAVSLAFGILFATPVTLILLPMIYLIANDILRGLLDVEYAPIEGAPARDETVTASAHV